MDRGHFEVCNLAAGPRFEPNLTFITIFPILYGDVSPEVSVGDSGVGSMVGIVSASIGKSSRFAASITKRVLVSS